MQCDAENAAVASQSCTGLPYLRTLAQDGPVLPTRFKVAQAVGAFSDVKVDYGPMRAGDVIEFNFSFVPSMSMNVGDSLTLYLRDFTGPPITNQKLPGSHNFGNATYEAASPGEFSKLTIVVWPDCIPAMTASQVNIPASLGIALPKDGVQAHLNKMYYAFEGQTSTIPTTKI